MGIRRAAPTPSGAEPESLSRLLDTALQRLRPLASAAEPGDGILFSGNRHETVPRALFLDPRLTPLERNAWQVFRLMLNDDGVTAFPTYAQLRPYLASVPCSGQASDETVARALTLLRLTRWLSQVRHRRDPETGRIQGNLYVLHDEPLSPFEALQLDPRYLSLVSQALTHASKAIQRVGYHTLKEITEDPLLTGRVLPTRLQMLIQRLATQEWAQAVPVDPQNEDTEPEYMARPVAGIDLRNSQDRTTASPRDSASPSSDSEVGPNTLKDMALRNPKKDRTVRTVHTDSINKDVRTVPRAREPHPSVQLPEAFAGLRPEQQVGAMAALQQVDTALQQLVLDEWAARCRSSKVRNPAGYLFGILQKALRGDFHAWAGQRPAGRSEHEGLTAPARGTDAMGARREVAQEHIAKLHAMLQMR